MNTDKMLLEVEDEDGTFSECWVDQFCRDNADGLDDVDIADVCHLKVGESLKFGGGAQPTTIVRRVS